MTTETLVTVACYCGLNKYQITLRTSSKHAETDMCHCSSCRHWSGGLCTSWLMCTPPPSLSNLTAYSTSPDAVEYFCSGCGSHMHPHDIPSGTWGVSVGVLEDVGDLEISVRQHKWVGDTGDGGLADWLPKMNGKVLDRWEAAPHKSLNLPQGWRQSKTGGESSNVLSEKEVEDKLWGKCHCGGIEFYITRPTEESKNAARRGWPPQYPPDLRATKEETWWLRPVGAENRTKYTAGICACDSCRRAHGFWAPVWAYVPLCNTFQKDGSPLVDFSHFGTLKTAPSHQGGHRDFCGTCGATVFWRHDWRSALINIAPGLLRAEEGARAENWLEWLPDGIIWEKDARDKQLVADLKEGMAALNPMSGH